MALPFVSPTNPRSKKLREESVVLRAAARIALMEARDALDRSREMVDRIKARPKTRFLQSGYV